MATINSSVEALKAQRDLYVAFRDLFLRHDRESSSVRHILSQLEDGASELVS